MALRGSGWGFWLRWASKTVVLVGLLADGPMIRLELGGVGRRVRANVA
jgi:hypothetical protein